MPASGGEARRLTYMPEHDLVMNWTPDGKKILFRSHRDEETQFRLYTIAVDGVFPDALPLPQGYAGSYSSDGSRIAYTPKPSPGEWRYYRGGAVSPVWIADLASGAVERLPHGNYNDRQPMWIGDKIYFISDRTGHANLFLYDLKTKQTRQLTSYNAHGIRFASAGGGAIAYVHEGRIHIYDLAGGGEKMIAVKCSPDTSKMKPRSVSAAQYVQSINVDAKGEQVIVGARGEIFSLDPKTGDARNLTETSAVAERDAAPSPDGQSIAYFSDESGEYQLYVRSSTGQVKKISVEQKPSFYRELVWSPDSKRIAFTDKRLALWVADVDARAARRIDSSTYSYQQEWYPRWSPDSRWLAYSKHHANRARTVYVYDVEASKAHQVTDGRTHTESPVFDASGKYLYFISSPNAGTSEFGWGVLNGVVARPLIRRSVHAIVLEEGAPSPLLPNGQPNPEAKIGERAAQVKIDFTRIGERVINLPLAPRDYSLLYTGRPGVLFALVAEWPSPPGFGSNPSQVLYRYDISQPPKFDKMIEAVDALDISGDGSRILFARRRAWFLVSSDAPPKQDEGKLELVKMQISLDPQAEWEQIYREAWRIMRDWFYDPNHHGQNLAELERHYAGYLPAITRRADLNRLMNQMLGHISVSHLGVGGGDVGPPPDQPSRVGLLGADYEIQQGRYRFKRIYRSSRYNDPAGAVAAPLDQPGISVREGEYLLSVDGQSIDASKNIYSYFEGKANRPVKITVGPSPDASQARALTVFPLAGENGLRRANWAEQNRRKVEEMSGGKLGYIFVADYGPSILDFIRGLTAYGDRQGIVIDQRFNGGGITPDYLIEWLNRKPLYYYMFREGDDIATPVNPGPPVKVLITNEWNGSAAETFAFMYKLGKIGPIVGWRTVGGGIGPYVYTPPFIDGGRVQLPNRAAYNPDGSSWGVENEGVRPDIEVDIMPRDFISGRDPQLERAVQVAMEELKKSAPSRPTRPKFPVHK
jgi:tricorn protease